MSINPIIFMNELEELPTADTQQRFQITDLSSLTWALRKMAAIEAKKAEINLVSDAEVARIEDYRRRELDSLQRSEDFFQGMIGEYALKKRDADPDYKSEKTPYGSISFRKQQPKWVYDDEKLVDYLTGNDLYDFVRIKQEPLKTEIKKQFRVSDDGRVIDVNGQEVKGITVEQLPDAFSVKVEV